MLRCPWSMVARSWSPTTTRNLATRCSQCAAVTTAALLTSEPPQKGAVVLGEVVFCRDTSPTCHGQACWAAGWPPTILDTGVKIRLLQTSTHMATGKHWQLVKL